MTSLLKKGKKRRIYTQTYDRDLQIRISSGQETGLSLLARIWSRQEGRDVTTSEVARQAINNLILSEVEIGRLNDSLVEILHGNIPRELITNESDEFEVTPVEGSIGERPDITTDSH